ncbi:hypothetical protein GCM10025298_21920 [Natronobiforma cellulositropha]
MYVDEVDSGTESGLEVVEQREIHVAVAEIGRAERLELDGEVDITGTGAHSRFASA